MKRHNWFWMLLVFPFALACAIPLSLPTATPNSPLPPTSAVMPTPFPVTSDFKPASVVNGIQGLYLRTQKDEQSNSIGIVPSGAEVLVVPASEEWWQVCWQPMKNEPTMLCGYANSKYLKLVKGE